VVGALPHTPLGELTALAAGRGSGKKGEGRRRVWKYKGWEKREGKEEGRRGGSWPSATKRGINATFVTILRHLYHGVKTVLVRRNSSAEFQQQDLNKSATAFTRCQHQFTPVAKR